MEMLRKCPITEENCARGICRLGNDKTPFCESAVMVLSFLATDLNERGLLNTHNGMDEFKEAFEVIISGFGFDENGMELFSDRILDTVRKDTGLEIFFSNGDEK